MHIGGRALLHCASRDWSPGFHDPTLVGWITFAAYLLAAALSWMVVARGHAAFASTARSSVLFWSIAALAVTLLGLNSQLDLQTWFTAVGRCAAKQAGWLAVRREVQYLFVVGFASALLVVFVAMVVVLRPAIRRAPMAAVGLVLLAAFVVVRAATIYHVDPIGGGPAHVLELAGISLLAVAAVQTLRTPRPTASV